MTARFDALGIIVSDMAATLAFYGLLGLDFDEDSEAAGHMEAKLPGGTRLMLDTEEVIASFDPDFRPPTGLVESGSLLSVINHRTSIVSAMR